MGYVVMFPSIFVFFQALTHPYFRGLSKPDREPSCQPIRKLEFDFEHRRMSKDDIRELIFQEILEYHPQLLKDYRDGTERTTFLYPRFCFFYGCTPSFLFIVLILSDCNTSWLCLSVLLTNLRSSFLILKKTMVVALFHRRENMHPFLGNIASLLCTILRWFGCQLIKYSSYESGRVDSPNG
jgi:hypothetical protein